MDINKLRTEKPKRQFDLIKFFLSNIRNIVFILLVIGFTFLVKNPYEVSNTIGTFLNQIYEGFTTGIRGSN